MKNKLENFILKFISLRVTDFINTQEFKLTQNNVKGDPNW